MALAFSTSSNSSTAHSVLSRAFTSLDDANADQEKSTSLEKESFPGELALLRQQNKQNQQMQQVIDVMPTGMIMLDGNGLSLIHI